MLLGSYLINDFKRINKTEILKKVRESTRFSFSFIILLVGSSIVCTLGLLLNSTAVVIGGMIIFPLMWPLMQTSIGISYGKMHYIKRALLVLLVATAISLLTAMFITFASPIKILNAEILARTNPTLIDIIIALVAGGVAALAITQPKISESLAGVAIATSMMPPLCVSGIGLALGNPEVFWGGLLLYFTNIVSIIFISNIVYLWLGFKDKSDDGIQKRALSITALILFLTAIPLFVLLRQLSFSTIAYSKTENILTDEFSRISSSIFVSTLNVTVVDSENLLVEAEVLVPEGTQISYEHRQRIQSELETELSRAVELRLRLQNTISILTQRDIEYNNVKGKISDAFVVRMNETKPDLTLDTLDIYQNAADNTWIVSGVMIGDPSIEFNVLDLQNLDEYIESQTGKEVLVSVEIISRVQLQAAPDEIEVQISEEVYRAFEELQNVEITSLSVELPDPDSQDPVQIIVDAKMPVGYQFPPSLMNSLIETIEEEQGVEIEISINALYIDLIEF